MDQEYLSIETSKGKLRYKKAGYGNKVVLLFHGFGQNKEVFNDLIKDWKVQFTFYSFDIFYHGNSYLETGVKEFTQNDFKEFMDLFFKKHALEKVRLIGFSMGGRFVNEIVMNFPDKVEEVNYVAPDGIRVNPWFKVATSTSMMRTIFKKIVHTPGLFFLLMKGLGRARIVHRGLIRFGIHQMDTVEKRMRVYNTWKMIYKIKTDTDQLAESFNKHQIKGRFFFGKYDQIVNRDMLGFFIDKLDHKQVKVYPTGHNRLLWMFCNNYID